MGDNTINIGTIGTAVFNNEAGNKTYNLYLCRRLSEALRDHSPNVKDFLSKIKEADKENWETQPRYTKIAFGNIISSFVGVLGILLQKLISSGKDAAKSNNSKDYLEVCTATAQRTMQLLCYSFFSKLWDHKKENKCEFTKEQSVIIDNFFNTNVELNISEYAELLKVLVNIFETHKIEYPFSEFSKECLNNDSSFIRACKNLEAIVNKKESGQAKTSVADEAEKELTEFLSTLTFLAGYKMVSVKEISYENARSKDAQYLHSYTFLGIDNDNDGKLFSSKYKYDSQPISSDAIIIYKNRYREGLNLFPFIIDMNALTNEMEAKICFYTYFEEERKKLIYTDINKISSDKNDSADDFSDPSLTEIHYNEEVENDLKANTEKDITRLKNDSKKYNDLQLNIVYKVFLNARDEISN